jgi:hypothetical protein
MMLFAVTVPEEAESAKRWKFWSGLLRGFAYEAEMLMKVRL